MRAPLRFFFYGTLIAGSRNPVARAAHRRLRAIGPARMRGRLYAVPDPAGWYPALLPGAGSVSGMLYAAGPRFGAADLARIDAYEDCDPARPAGSLYVRRARIVAAGALRARAQVYLFNRPLPRGARRIAHGDFHAWLSARGLRAFGDRSDRIQAR